MGDCESLISTFDGEQHVLVAAQHIVKALAASKNVSNDMRKILADLDIHLSTMTKFTESEAGRTSEVEDRLNCVQKKVITLQSNQSMIWDLGPREASEYLQAVDEVRRLIESLGNLLSNRNGKGKELLNRAHDVLQMAMARLEEELIHILTQNKQYFEPDSTSFRSCEENRVYEESVVSTEDDLVEETSRRESSGTESEESTTDLVHPDVVSHIKSIANIMFASNYDHEFCHAFISFWKASLDEYLINLGADNLSIEDVMKMDWSSLNGKIWKWCRAMKIVVRSFLASEKRLFDQVLGEFGHVSSTCFVEASKASMSCLLNFGIAIAIGPHRPERLSRLIDMYEVLGNLLQDIDALFLEEIGSFLRIEFHELLRRLGNSARATFLEFGNQVGSGTSITPFPRGGIHHLTKYVMNYLTLLPQYVDTLNLLLEEQEGEGLDPYIFCPLAHHLRAVTSLLETNLDNKSNLYRDDSLKHIFMMNNIHYMVQKVKDSELRTYFGDGWIREHIAKFKQHATWYERASWSSVLSLIRDDGSTRKAVLKERCRSFDIAFEEVYKNQTGWFVPDLRLREDLQISTSQKVIQAYRAFTGNKAAAAIIEKYIKYTTDDLENRILDLFIGSPRSLHKPRWS